MGKRREEREDQVELTSEAKRAALKQSGGAGDDDKGTGGLENEEG